jgi:hypothetical protein
MVWPKNRPRQAPDLPPGARRMQKAFDLHSKTGI